MCQSVGPSDARTTPAHPVSKCQEVDVVGRLVTQVDQVAVVSLRLRMGGSAKAASETKQERRWNTQAAGSHRLCSSSLCRARSGGPARWHDLSDGQATTETNRKGLA